MATKTSLIVETFNPSTSKTKKATQNFANPKVSNAVLKQGVQMMYELSNNSVTSVKRLDKDDITNVPKPNYDFDTHELKISLPEFGDDKGATYLNQVLLDFVNFYQDKNNYPHYTTITGSHSDTIIYGTLADGTTITAENASSYVGSKISDNAFNVKTNSFAMYNGSEWMPGMKFSLYNQMKMPVENALNLKEAGTLNLPNFFQWLNDQIATQMAAITSNTKQYSVLPAITFSYDSVEAALVIKPSWGTPISDSNKLTSCTIKLPRNNVTTSDPAVAFWSRLFAMADDLKSWADAHGDITFTRP